MCTCAHSTLVRQSCWLQSSCNYLLHPETATPACSHAQGGLVDPEENGLAPARGCLGDQQALAPLDAQTQADLGGVVEEDGLQVLQALSPVCIEQGASQLGTDPTAGEELGVELAQGCLRGTGSVLVQPETECSAAVAGEIAYQRWLVLRELVQQIERPAPQKASAAKR